MNLLRMSLAGAVMILVIVIVRALAIHRLPKKAFLALWCIATVRLLIPYSLPSALSIYSLAGHLAPAVEATVDMPIIPFVPAVPADAAAHTPTAPAPAAPAPGAPVTPGTDVPGTDVPGKAAVVDPWALIWLAGALGCGVFFAAAYVKCRREFKVSLPVKNEYAAQWLEEHRLRRTVAIRQSGRISAPLTYGVFRPVILMPKTADWGDRDTLKYVLAHEYVHIRRFDAVTKLVLTAALCIHWFNPAVWIMYVLANRDIELSCDEAVIRQFGEATKAAYATALIRMEEVRSGLTPLCNNFSKNAIEERIVAIMKIKKTTLLALIVAVALIAGVTTAFATSAKGGESLPAREVDGKLDAADTYQGTATLTSYVDPRDGRTYYSFDGGKTYEPLTDEEFAARFPTPKVEWWTYEEYKAWLENEKIALQSMIGERAWTSGRGEFIWTQEIVDEAIAMYEGILENIGRGMLYSKTIDGEPDTSLMLGMDPADIWMDAQEATVTDVDFTQYKPFDLAWDDGEKALYLHGQRVRYFFDGVEVEEAGGMSIYFQYTDAELKGDIDVHTVRERIQNADGSFDLMGPITGLEAYSQAEFDARTFPLPSPDAADDVVQQFDQNRVMKTEARLEDYVPFGLSYEFDPATGALIMRWQGKPVHGIFDVVKRLWIANSMRGLYLGPDAVDLEAVYEQGMLIGLRETQYCPMVQAAFASDDEGTEEFAFGTAFAMNGHGGAWAGMGANMPPAMAQRYKAILLGEEDFVNIDRKDRDINLNIANIKAVVSDEDWVTARVTEFALVDLDGNGEDEVILWIRANDDPYYGFEILYSQNGEVYGFTLPYRAFMHLKADGTFYWSGGAANNGYGRLQFSERGYTVEEVFGSWSPEEKADAVWYDLTPTNIELVFGN